MRLIYILLLYPLLTFGQSTSYVEQNISLELDAGWNMFGYSCYDPMDLVEALSPVVDKVIIVKNNDGKAYLPEFGYNGIGNLELHQGYQIKLTEAITDFQFCPFLVPLVEGCMNPNSFNYDALATKDDGSCIPTIKGCIDPFACNYDSEANTDDGSCIDLEEGSICITTVGFDECQCGSELIQCYYASIEDIWPWPEGSFCKEDTSGVVLGPGVVEDCECKLKGCLDFSACNFNLFATSDDGSCEYPEQGYDCDGNITAQIGDHAFGGIVFYVDETGERGLVADTGNVAGLFEWGCFDIDIPNLYPSYILSGAENTQNIINQNCHTEDGNISAAEFAVSFKNQSYVDWFLPSKSEFQTLIDNIGLSDELFHPILDNFSYWTSTQWGNLTSFSYDSELNVFVEKTKHSECAVIPIRAFGYTLGCMDSFACNFNPEANMSDGSCEYAEVYDCDGNLRDDLFELPDTAFRNYLKENYPEVMEYDFLNIDSTATYDRDYFYIPRTNISDLNGIQYFSNVDTIDIWDNDALTSIPELSGLSNLSSLHIFDNDTLTSIPDLSGLSNLGWLRIGGNDALTSIPELSGLKNLHKLWIVNNDTLTSIPDLSGLTNLYRLYINGNETLISIPDLSGLSNLNTLSIDSNNALECIIGGYPSQLTIQESWPPICD